MAKQLTLWIFKPNDYDTDITDKQPVFEGGKVRSAKDASSVELCTKGREVLGINREVKDNELIKLTLTVDKIESMEYEIVAKLKPFTSMKKKDKRKKEKV